MPFSWIYGAIADWRNSLYERGALRSFALGAPALSVGNLTVGGTGKTPFVALAAEILAAAGARPCVLTRGYGRENPRRRVLVSDGRTIIATPREAGDEPFELARRLLGKAAVLADADRVAAARWALENISPTVFVLDDAFQHRRARRDLDIVLIDATDPFGNGRTLPFGVLREPPANLRRAGAIVVTRVNLCTDRELSALGTRLSSFNPNAPIFTAANRIERLTGLVDFHAASQFPDEDRRPIIEDRRPAFAFCALGNPDNFFEQLRRENFALAGTRAFPDHHRYAAADAARIDALAAECGARVLLTTGKDAVKLQNFSFALPCLVVETSLLIDDEKKLRRMIGAVIIQKKSDVEVEN